MDRMEIHSHSEYSNLRLLDCINKPKKLVNYAKSIGLKGLCVTDHECLSSHIIFNKLAQADPDFKIGLGNEIYLVDERPTLNHYHFILVAKDKEGHKQLRYLSSLAWMNSYTAGGIERVDTLKSDLERVVKENPGHLIASTACLGSELDKLILALDNAERLGVVDQANKIRNKIVDFLAWCDSLFGEDFYIECQPGASKDQIIVNKRLRNIAETYDIKLIVTTDAHYMRKSDRFTHKAYLESDDGEREIDSFYEYAYLQTEDEIIENLHASGFENEIIERMFANTMDIFNKIEVYSLLHSQQIPKVEVSNYRRGNRIGDDKYPILKDMLWSDNVVERYWVNECINKLEELGKLNDTYLARLEEEADTKRVIGEKLNTNMFAYPVTLQHYVNLFWECGSAVGAGRGSSCAGLNHYLLGVTQLDPIEWNFPWFRYLNKERVELGDIDIDLAPSKRPAILKEICKERSANIREDLDDLSRTKLGCTLIATFGTETSKRAVQTACRGYRSADYPDGIDIDTAKYLSGLIPEERGFVWSLSDVYHGNVDEGRRPVTTFINEVNKYPNLIDIMLSIEGLISQRGSHASGVIMFDEDPYEFGCFMKTPSGDIITQYDLHDDEAAGMTKYDFLVTEIEDKIIQCIKLLQDDGQIDSTLTLHEVYDKYLHPNVLNYNNKEVWDAICNVKVLDLFQFDSMVGRQGAKKVQPRTIQEMSDCNGLIRLLAGDSDEIPLDKYVRFKNNLKLWYKEMDKYGLTKDEQKHLEPYFKQSYGVPPSQEQLMLMLMDENLCHFTLKEANAARKTVAKKKLSEIPALHEKVLSQASSPALGRYIWECGIGPQMSYSFSVIHATAYSIIGFQTAFLATKWNPIYWNTACLIVNSGSLEIDSDKGTDYAKVATAIGAIRQNGINISLVDINKSSFGFIPDVEHNQIMFGMKGLPRMNGDAMNAIIAGRPYKSIMDFMERCKLNNTLQMIALIKAGAFDAIDSHWATKFNPEPRYGIMAYYLLTTSDLKAKINLQNFNSLIEHDLLPSQLDFETSVYKFNIYLKTHCKDGKNYKLDNDAYSFYESNFDLSKLQIIGGSIYIDQKVWEKVYKKIMENAANWLKANQSNILEELNDKIFKAAWDKYASGSISAWEMEALCFYYHDHELANVNLKKYNVSNFNNLISNDVDKYGGRAGRQYPIYKLFRIAGTVIAKDDKHSTVMLLTTHGVVPVKFTKEYYAMYNRQISSLCDDNKMHITDKSWFARGTILMVTGYRREDTFVAKKYKSATSTHQLYRVQVVDNDIILTHNRVGQNDQEEGSIVAN